MSTPTTNPLPRLRLYRRVLVAACVASFLAPQIASAHEKWFVDASKYPLRWDLLFSLPVAIALGTALLALLALISLRKLVGNPLFPDPPWLRPVNPSVQAVLGIQTAISLVYMTANGWLLAPTLTLPMSLVGYGLLALQLFISFTFVTGWLTRIGGVLLIALVLLSPLLFPISQALEQLLFIGIGIYFLIEGRGLFLPHAGLPYKASLYWSRFSSRALPILRIFTGLSILWLAFSEKLLNPDLAVAFLKEWKDFNFMQSFGLSWFSNDLFIYSAAAVEATVGVLLIAGVLPRVVILLMWVPFNAAIPLLPPQELLGHLPILAVMYAVFLGAVYTHSPSSHPLPAPRQTHPPPPAYT